MDRIKSSTAVTLVPFLSIPAGDPGRSHPLRLYYFPNRIFRKRWGLPSISKPRIAADKIMNRIRRQEWRDLQAVGHSKVLQGLPPMHLEAINEPKL
jgi:hypothetical protein